jgi:endonuclease-3 related protein
LGRHEKLVAIYNALLERYGDRHWWPAETPFEMMVGAILTQNVSWRNASMAISALKDAGLLAPFALENAPPERLAPLLKPARFMNLKARRLKSFAEWYSKEFDSNIERMSRCDTRDLRKKLLEVNGIGKETADCILLYACDKPVFVVDAYARRVFGRLGLIEENPDYDDLQSFLMRNLPLDVALYKDYHAQIVHLAKETCRQRPLCRRCPIRRIRGVPQCRSAIP